MSEFTVQLILLIVPGAISSLIVERLTVHRPWNQFRFVLYSILLGGVSYAILDVARLLVLSRLEEADIESMRVWGVLAGDPSAIPPWEIAGATFVGVIIALIVTASVQRKWLHKIGSRLRVSTKYGDENLFSYFLSSPDTAWIFVSDRDAGLTYQGQLHSYSEDDSVREIVLTEASVYTYSDSEHLYDLAYLYLSFGPGNLAIEVQPVESEGVRDYAEEQDEDGRAS